MSQEGVCVMQDLGAGSEYDQNTLYRILKELVV